MTSIRTIVVCLTTALLLEGCAAGVSAPSPANQILGNYNAAQNRATLQAAE